MAHFSPKRSRKKDIQSPKSHHRSILNKDQLIWGIHSILEALKTCPHCVTEIFVEKGRKGLRLEELLEMAQQNSVPVTFGTSTVEMTYKKYSGPFRAGKFTGGFSQDYPAGAYPG